MAKPLSPDIVRAYEMIKAGQRYEAGQLLKDYLSSHPQDTDAWWLMAHAVSRRENQMKCLEQVLKIDPNHSRAQEKLARLQSASAEEAQRAIFDTSIPTRIQAPRNVTAPVPAPAVPAPVPPPAPAPTPAPSFEDFTRRTPPPAASTASLGSPFLQAEAVAAAPGPAAAAESAPAAPDLPRLTSSDDGPRPKPPKPRRKGAPPLPDEEETAALASSTGVEKVIGLALVAIALVVLVGLALFIANQRGWVHLWGLPEMTRLEASSFALEYPEQWNAICKTERQGYPVCGVANDPRYNRVDWYTGQDVDIAGMFAGMFSFGSIFGFDSPPDLQVSVVAMDVLESSPAYDDASMAKIMYDTTQEWGIYDSDDYDIKYDRREITVDGRTGYYYRFTLEDKSGGLKSFVQGSRGNTAFYDLYVPHDGLMFWMTVQVFTTRNSKEIPDDIIQHMIETIHFKPRPASS